MSEHWSEIDQNAGYQKLCGTKALEFVRFRHLDNDIVRAARQQGFLRLAKDQLNQAGVFKHLKPLVRIFARATESDGDLQPPAASSGSPRSWSARAASRCGRSTFPPRSSSTAR